MVNPTENRNPTKKAEYVGALKGKWVKNNSAPFSSIIGWEED
jgi:hypothetical protein